MVFKPFTNLARQSISKHLVNGYAQSVVAATQSSYASSTLPLHKLSNNTPAKLYNVFGGAHSGRTAPGKDANGSDALNSSYAVQSATAEDKDEKKYLFSGKILWSKAQHQQQQQQLLGAPQPMSETSPKERRDSVTGALEEVELEKVGEEVLKAEEVAVEEEVLVDEEAVEVEEGSLLADAAAQITEQYNAQLQMLRDEGRYHEVIAVFQHMAAEGVKPNTVSYNFYLSAIVGLRPKTVGGVLEVYRAMLREMVTPSTSTYSILLDFLSTTAIRNFTVVRKIERDAERFGVLLPSKAEEAAELKKDGAMDVALELFYASTDVRKRSFPIQIYSGLMHACSKYGKDDDMVKIAMHMDAHHIEPSIDIVRSMIRGFGRTGNLPTAVQTYNSWLELDYARDESLMDQRYMVYRDLIKAYMDCGDALGAISFLERVVEVNQDFSRIEWLTQAVIKGLVEEGDTSSAQLWATQLSNSKANSIWLAKLLATAADKGELDFSRSLYNSILSTPSDHHRQSSSLTNHQTSLSPSHQTTHLLNPLPLFPFMNNEFTMTTNVNMSETNMEELNIIKFHLAQCQMSALALCIRDDNLALGRDVWLDLNNPSSSTGPSVTAALAWVQYLFENDAPTEACVVLKQFGDFFMDRYSPEPGVPVPANFFEQKRQTLHECYECLIVRLNNKDVLTPSIAMDIAGFAREKCGSVLSSSASRIIMSTLTADRIPGLSVPQLSLIIPFQLASMRVNYDKGLPQEASDINNMAALIDAAIAARFPLSSVECEMMNVAAGIIHRFDQPSAAKWGRHLQLTIDAVVAAQQAPQMLQTPPESSRNSPTSSVVATSHSLPAASEEAVASGIDPNYDPHWQKTDVRTSNLIDAQLERNKFHKIADLRRMYRATRRNGRHLRIDTVGRLITAVAKTNSYEDFIDELYRNATVDTPLKPEYPFLRTQWIELMDSMIAALLNLGKREKAASYHDQLTALGAAPSANTFGLYIVSLKTAGTHDEATDAVKVFNRAVREGVAPTQFLYNAVIGKLAKARRVDDCLFYFADMRARNLKPTSVSYGTMINALTRVGDENFAEELFNEMEDCPMYRPRPAPYNSMMQFFINTKRDRTKVLAYYTRMKSQNIAPTAHTFKLLVEAYAVLTPPDLPAAENVLAEIRKHNMPVLSSHHATLILAKGNVFHNVDAATAHFHSVLADGMRPDSTLYQALLEVLVANHRVHETGKWVQHMHDHGVQMTPYIANSLIHGWRTEKNIDMCENIYNQVAKKEPSTYEQMVRAYLAVEDRRGAKSVADEMCTKRYPHAVVSRVLDLVRGVNVAETN